MTDTLAKFSHRIRVRYGEVDPQSVVFNARYLDYADLAITEYWRTFGLMPVPEPGAPEFMLVRAEVDFKAPLLADEEFDLHVFTVEIGNSSITSAIEMRGLAGDLRAMVSEVHVHVDMTSRKSVPIPDGFVAKLELYEARTLRRAKR